MKDYDRNGDWDSGGSCDSEKLPDLGIATPGPRGFHFDIVADVLLKRWNESQVQNLNILNVTDMSSFRKDGHPSKYGHFHQDCSHWCLPGVPDSWNELLYALFLKREISHVKNPAPFVIV